MAYISRVQIDNGNPYLIEPTLFAVASGTSSAFTATINNFELVAGVMITLQIQNTNSSAATLSINGANAAAIQYQGSVIEANILKQGHIYNLVYDGNVWHVLGEKLSSAEMSMPHKLTFGAGGVYQYDGSADVTVPVYAGNFLSN